MLLDPETLELTARAPEVLALLDGDPRYKLELPASQFETLTAPAPEVPAAAAALLESRRELQRITEGIARPAAAGVHPFSPGTGILNEASRYAFTRREYGGVAARQLVCALQVHVAVPGAERALGVYNALRSHLPELAALAANAPFYEARDTGLASVRPKLSELLPRQGVPPALASWEEHADGLRWGMASATVPDPGLWWWELRPHPVFGTLELRVPDGQTTVADAGAIAAVVQSLAAALGERHDAGDLPMPAATWRIEENRWSACRHGVEGEMADLERGGRRPTRDRLHALLDGLEVHADRLGAGREVAHARDMVQANGAIAQRRVAREQGLHGLAAWLAERFAEGRDDASGGDGRVSPG